MTEVRKDVAVVGGGIAGLVAATRLVDGGRDVVVLEARPRVGGRLLNEDIGGGDVVEVGGQWVGESQPRVTELIRELSLETFPTYNTGQHLLELDSTLRRYRGRLALDEAVVQAIDDASRALEDLAETVDLDRPWATPGADALDRRTFHSWIEESCTDAAVRSYFRLFAQGVLATEPANVSLLHTLFYVRSGGGLSQLMGTGRGAQQRRVVGGSQRIALELAERLGASRVVVDSPVRRIGWDDGGVRVTTDDLTVLASHAVVAVAPNLASRISYEPKLPPARDMLTQRVPHGSVIKCMAVYARPFWRDEGLSGQVTSDRGPVGIVYDNSPPHGGRGVLLASTGRGGFLRAVLRAGGPVDRALRRAGLVGGGMDTRLLRRSSAAWRMDTVRSCSTGAGGADSLGQRRDSHGLVRLHRGRRRVWRPGRCTDTGHCRRRCRSGCEPVVARLVTNLSGCPGTQRAHAANRRVRRHPHTYFAPYDTDDDRTPYDAVKGGCFATRKGTSDATGCAAAIAMPSGVGVMTAASPAPEVLPDTRKNRAPQRPAPASVHVRDEAR